MKATPSPIHPEQDQVGQPRLSSPHADKPYPINPYWGKSTPSAHVPASFMPDEPPQSSPQSQPDPTLFDAHLIDIITGTIRELGKFQRDELTLHLTNWLLKLPEKLTPGVEAYLDKVVPRVVRVEHPGRTLLLLVRYLTGGMVVSGLLIGGLLYSWLEARQARDSFASGYWQHRYIVARASMAGSPGLSRLVQDADTVYNSAGFHQELTRLESIIDARHQQYLFQQREHELIHAKRVRSK